MKATAWGSAGIACLLLTVASGPVAALDGTKLAPYALECKRQLGELPKTWNCLDGVELKVGAHDGDRCAMPPWLTLGGTSQCVDGARLLRLKMANENSQAVVICRRYGLVADQPKLFEDVAVVMHDRESGATCFFQARKNEGLDGTAVPSPMADPDKLEEARAAKDATDFWLEPEQLDDDALRCTLCHDNDAWMHTPYVDQVPDEAKVPAGGGQDRWEGDKLTKVVPYNLVEQAYLLGRTWPDPLAIRTANVKRKGDATATRQACTLCHRITNRQTGSTWISWSTDVNRVAGASPVTDLAARHWMPRSPNVTTEEEWSAKYGPHIKALTCCIDNPAKLGCGSFKVLGTKPGDAITWGMAENGVCVHETGEVAFRVRLDPKVQGGRAAGGASCDEVVGDMFASVDVEVVHLEEDGTTTTINEDLSHRALGASAPDNRYGAERPVFPGDVVTATLDTTAAWDGEQHPLDFDRWIGVGEGGAEDPAACPCADPTSTQCSFRTKGASDWFGANPDDPAYPGDPPRFECMARFEPVGECVASDDTLPSGSTGIGGLIDCDCEHVDFGLLTGAFAEECRASEAALIDLADTGAFRIELGEDGKIAGGTLCDSVTAGPAAWPIAGAPSTPPPKPDGPECRFVGGLLQYDCS